MKKLILSLFIFFIFFIRLSGQGINCNTAKPFCLGGTYTYPAVTNVPSPVPYPSYPNYGCLSILPNPSWYYMKVANSGSFVIHISSTPHEDLDFVCWGPFSSPIIACMDSLLTGNCSGFGCPDNVGNPTFYPSGNIVDCSMSVNSSEDCHIYGALTGQYFILLVTNYSNMPCNLIFTQTNAGMAGAGTTDCSIMQGPIHNNGPFCGDTLKLFADTVIGASYSWTGPNGWTSFQQNPVIPNATTAFAGIYTCVFTVGTQLSPVYTTNVSINTLPPASAGAISGSTTVMQGQQNVIYTVPLIPGADSYIWSLPPGAGGTSTTNTINVIYSGNAHSGVVKVKGHNACGDGNYSSLNVFVQYNTGTGIYTGDGINVYPSPASLSLTITYNLKISQKFSLDIYDITGRKIKELVDTFQQSGEHHLTLDTSELTQGIYFIKARGNDSFETAKFSVVH